MTDPSTIVPSPAAGSRNGPRPSVEHGTRIHAMTLLMWEGHLFTDAWKAAWYPSAGAARTAVYRLRRRAIAYMGREVNEVLTLKPLFGKRGSDLLVSL